MQKTEAAMILAGVTPEEQRQASAPTNLHVITGTVTGKSNSGKTQVSVDGLIFTADNSQHIEIDTLGGLEEGDVATILLTGENGHGMTPLAVGALGSIDRIDGYAQSAINSAAAAAVAAGEAKEAAEQAVEDAGVANRAAQQAQEDADTAKDAADQAVIDAGVANRAAQQAQEDADAAKDAADQAQEDATDAKNSARIANIAANDSLAQLSIIEDVSGTLKWIQEHGTYIPTSDTTVQEGTVYFELIDGDWVPIASPDRDANPAELGWATVDISDSQSEYIMAHMAITARGLWILPSGIGEASSPQVAAGYKLLLSSDGSYLYDASGHLVTTYGESIIFDSSRPQSIGGENAHITYYDSDDDGVPDSIYIGGSSVSIGGKTLSEFTQAIDDASEAKQIAEDIPIVTLSSTNGTVFKRTMGVSTTVVATIFTPGGRIQTATQLRNRFGAGAYLEWGWRDVVTDADHVLPTNDPRIGMGGFSLTVSPEDIDTQAVITCSLNY